MYSLLICENKNAVECNLQHGDSFIDFDATTEIFEILKGRGSLIEFMGSEGASERCRIEAMRHIESSLRGQMGIDDIEIEMGYSHVSFPVVASEENGPVFLDFPVIAYGTKYPIYRCENLQSVVLCLLRYFTTNSYKYAKCKHCGKPFLTKNLHTIYCNRNSPYIGYERYSCKDAVKHINDFLEKRRRVIYERLRVRAEEFGYHTKYGERLRAFEERYTCYKHAIKKNASVSNLMEYQKYLYDDTNFPKRYDRIR